MSGNERNRQHGAAMVEMALTLVIFLMLVFGIIEFALAYLSWHRTAEAVREGARHAIVSTPETSLAGLACPGGAAVSTICTADSCPALFAVMRQLDPLLGSGPEQVSVAYACSGAGSPDRPAELVIPEVTVSVTGLRYTFVVPGIIGLGSDISLPAVTVTRTGEDLYSAPAE